MHPYPHTGRTGKDRGSTGSTQVEYRQVHRGIEVNMVHTSVRVHEGIGREGFFLFLFF